MKKCPSCSKTLPDSAVFCPKCGTKLNIKDNGDKNKIEPIIKNERTVEVTCTEPEKHNLIKSKESVSSREINLAAPIIGVIAVFAVLVISLIVVIRFKDSTVNQKAQTESGSPIEQKDNAQETDAGNVTETVKDDVVSTSYKVTKLGRIKVNDERDKICVSDYSGLLLVATEAHLISKGFNGAIKYESSEGKKIDTDFDNWIIVSQSVESGDSIKNDGKITFTCVPKQYNVFLQITTKFDKKAEYDYLIVRIDDDEVGQITKENNNDMAAKLAPGKHTVSISDKDNNELASEKITIESDTMFKGQIEVDKKKASIKKFEQSEVDKDMLIEMPDVCYTTLSYAVNQLESCGFSNISYYADGDISDTNQWIVVKQDDNVGQLVKIGKDIILECVSLDNYLDEYYICDSAEDATKIAETLGNEIIFIESDSLKDVSDSVKKKKDWIVCNADIVGKTVTAYIIKEQKVTVPDVTGISMDEAVNRLSEQGIINVVIISGDNNEITGSSIVAVQNLTAGQKVSNTEQIELKIESNSE